MTIRTLAQVQSYFNTGDVPSETQFADAFHTAIISDDVVGALSGASSPSAANPFATRSAVSPWMSIYNIKDFGAVGDGVTDDTTPLNNALAAAYAAGGGSIVFDADSYLISGKITIPNDGASVPTQAPLRLTGRAVSHFSNINSGVIASTGTKLLMPYAGTVGCLVSFGLGTLEIDHIAFVNSGSGSLPFIYLTNTKPVIHDCVFLGDTNKSGASCDQTAIIFGGTSSTYSGDETAPFQGINGSLERCSFGNLEKAFHANLGFNGMNIQNNIIAGTCGTADVAGAAMTIDGVTETVSGNLFIGNYIAQTHYPYGIKCTAAARNLFIGNSTYSESATTIAGIRFDSTANYNMVYAGYISDSKSAMSDGSTGKTNWCFNPNQAGGTIFANSIQIQNGYLTLLGDASNAWGASLKNTAGSYFRQQADFGTFPTIHQYYHPSGGSDEDAFYCMKLFGHWYFLADRIGTTTAAASGAVGNIVGKKAEYDASGNFVGYSPIYDAIT